MFAFFVTFAARSSPSVSPASVAAGTSDVFAVSVVLGAAFAASSYRCFGDLTASRLFAASFCFSALSASLAFCDALEPYLLPKDVWPATECFLFFILIGELW